MMPIARTALLLFVATVASFVPACSSGGSDAAPPAPIHLTVSGGCGDAYLWATTSRGDIAVTVSVDAQDRATDAPTTIPVVVPDDDVAVEVLRGRDLARNFCNDVLDADSEPTSTKAATAGRGTIVLGPASDEGMGRGCGQTTGRMRLTGLRAADGTRFAPIEAKTDQIRCYAG